MDSDQVDGQRQRTRSIRTKFTIPLCCFGAGSELTAEVNINSSDTQTDTQVNSQAVPNAEAKNTDTSTKEESKQESKPPANG
jgi:hypothetical protein